MQLQEILKKLKNFDVLNIKIENEQVKLQIQVYKGENLIEKEEYIKLLLENINVSIIFIIKEEVKKKIKKVFGICSGKGGVGKSTIALHLAFQLRDLGYKVGLLDADILNPSIPFFLNAKNTPNSLDGDSIEVIKTHGLQMLSMGLFMQSNQAIVWQNNMISAGFRQLLQQGNWEVDYLIIDFPPGINELYEVCKTQLQEIEMILISGPNKLIYTDVIRLYIVLKTYGINIKGVIENNAYNISKEYNQFDIYDNFKDLNAIYKDLELLCKMPNFKTFFEFSQKSYPENYVNTMEKEDFTNLVQKLI